MNHPRILQLSTVLLVVGLSFAASRGEGVLHVDDAALAGGDGLTWDTAYRFLQDALADAAADASISEIRVAEGTYLPDRDEAHPDGTADREATFQLLDGVALLGGFAGPGAPDPDERDIALYETILSGNIGDPDTPTDNSYHVVTGSATDNTAVVDGFTITEGSAIAFGPSHSRGAGMLNVDGSPTISECTFTSNVAHQRPLMDGDTPHPDAFGAGMYNANSDPIITECTFSDNLAYGDGGGIFNASSSPIIVGCTFSNNRSLDPPNTGGTRPGRGGGISNDTSSPTLMDCAFQGNESARGGAVYDDSLTESTFFDCAFTDNFAEFGGASHANGITNVTGCSFFSNSATGGGAIFTGSDSAVLSVADSEFCDNAPTHIVGDWIDDSGNVLCPLCDPASGAVLAVPSEYSSIQAAIDAACDGAQIVVGPGTYLETINLSGKAIVLRSSDGADFTTIDGQTTGRVIECVNGEGADTLIEGFTITGGDAVAGGGMRVFGSSPSLIDCTFVLNTAPIGGGLCVVGGSPTIAGCTFAENVAWNAGNVWGGGGGIFVQSGSPMVFNCTFNANVGTSHIWGPNVSFGAPGAAIYNASSGTTVVNSLFVGNSAGSASGGAIHSTANSVIANCVFAGNQGSVGGALCDAYLASSTVVNCTFVGNVATGWSIPGGGNMHADGEGGAVWGDTVVTNCILRENTPDQVYGEATVGYCNVEGGWLGQGAHNIDVDPQFFSAADGDYRLSANSPCIDAGNNNAIAQHAATDLDGNPRFADDPATADTGCGVSAVVDMGAYEYQGDPAEVVFADLTGDGVVGLEDFAALLDCWSSSGDACCLADLDLDGAVGVVDFLILLANWG